MLCFQCIHLRISKIGIKNIFFQKPPDSVTIQDSPYHGGVWGIGCYRKSEGHFQDINVFILKTWKLKYSRWACCSPPNMTQFQSGLFPPHLVLDPLHWLELPSASSMLPPLAKGALFLSYCTFLLTCAYVSAG